MDKGLRGRSLYGGQGFARQIRRRWTRVCEADPYTVDKGLRGRSVDAGQGFARQIRRRWTRVWRHLTCLCFLTEILLEPMSCELSLDLTLEC